MSSVFWDRNKPPVPFPDANADAGRGWIRIHPIECFANLIHPSCRRVNVSYRICILFTLAIMRAHLDPIAVEIRCLLRRQRPIPAVFDVTRRSWWRPCCHFERRMVCEYRFVYTRPLHRGIPGHVSRSAFRVVLDVSDGSKVVLCTMWWYRLYPMGYGGCCCSHAIDAVHALLFTQIQHQCLFLREH